MSFLTDSAEVNVDTLPKNLHNESTVRPIIINNYSRRYDNDFRANRTPTGLKRCKQFLLRANKLAVNTLNALNTTTRSMAHTQSATVCCSRLWRWNEININYNKIQLKWETIVNTFFYCYPFCIYIRLIVSWQSQTKKNHKCCEWWWCV